ncbi:hypothetical protein [Sulfurimonas sp. HSL-1716]|uniref:hypothetical protein n=1 Tax=Hydrocurvibacter sulfurireducens TaxID=3131937 RepID=UPI0031F8399C
MKREILIVTVLMTNIAFASVLPAGVRTIREIDTNKNTINTLSSAASMRLYKRGLEKETANQKVLRSLNGDEHTNSLMAQNIMDHFKEIKNEDIVRYISDCALFEKKVNLSSYDDIIALLQKTNRFKLDEDSLKKIQKISLENQKITQVLS